MGTQAVLRRWVSQEADGASTIGAFLVPGQCDCIGAKSRNEVGPSPNGCNFGRSGRWNRPRLAGPAGNRMIVGGIRGWRRRLHQNPMETSGLKPKREHEEVSLLPKLAYGQQRIRGYVR
jgi:hypothetical protein